MKVLMYGWEFPPYISGGLGVACQAMVNELGRKGVKVTLVLPMEVKDHAGNNFSLVGCGSNFSNTTVNIKRAQFTSGLNPYISLPRLNSIKLDSLFQHGFLQWDSDQFHLTGKYGMNLLEEVFYYAVIAGKLAREIEHDVIHAHDWLTILAGIEARKYSHKLLIFHVHALETDRSGAFVNPDIFAIEKYGLEQADKIIAVSEYTKNCIIDHYNINPKKIVVIHNGTYLNKQKHAHQVNAVKTVLFVGRLTNQKGPHFFIEAANKLLHFFHNVKFVVVGTGDLQHELIERVATFGIGKYIHFAGFLDQDMVDNMYDAADLYVMPSVSEPFGLTCLEALSRNVPVIISKQSGVGEALHHVLKVDFWDVNEMTNKMLAVLKRPPLVRTMLANARRELKNLTWDMTADAIIALYAYYT